MPKKAPVHVYEFTCLICGYSTYVTASYVAEAIAPGFQLHDIHQEESRNKCFNPEKKCRVKNIENQKLV